MIDWMGLASIYAAFLIVAASPGPATLAVCAVSAASGRKSGMVFGAGLSIGLAFWGLVAATGLGAVLQASTHLLIALKVAGGAYLLWLAYGSARNAMRVAPPRPDPGNHLRPSLRFLFAKGLALNLFNPKAVVAWMSALSVGLGTENSWVGLGVATLGCALIGLAIYMAYAAAFSLSVIMNGYVMCRRRIDGVVSVIFAMTGMALIRSALTRS